MSEYKFLTETGELADAKRGYLRQLIRICVPALKLYHGPDAEATVAGVEAFLQQAAHEVVLPVGYADQMREALFSAVLKLVRAAYDPSLERTLERLRHLQEELDTRAEQPAV